VTAALPEGACDCHVHVVGPATRFPFLADRPYTPADATYAMLQERMRDLGIDRTVIVQPSFYGTDNRCTLDALAQFGPTARGVAAVAPDIDPAALDGLHQAGVRGLRVNLGSNANAALDGARDSLAQAAGQCARNGWHIQIYATPALLSPLLPDLARLGVPVVVDHFGLAPTDLARPYVAALVQALRHGPLWLKLSAPYRLDADAGSITRLARHLTQAAPGRMLWGTDWPHPPVHSGRPEPGAPPRPYRAIDGRALLRMTQDWFPDPAVRRQVLTDNPARLYDFAPG